MKKAPLLSSVLLAVTAPLASAAGINLAWNNCYPSTGAARNMGSLCDSESNSSVYQFYGSVVTGVAIPDFVAQGNVIDIQVAAPVLDDWWMMGPGECRDGAFAGQLGMFTNTTLCNKAMMGTQFVSQTDYASKHFGQQNRARMILVASRTTPVALQATAEYQLFVVSIAGDHSAADPTDPTYAVCAGCADPACIIFNSCQLDMKSGASLVLSTPQNLPGFVSWHVDNPCFTVPTQKPTWGKIKSMYR